jgi:hypothetical protein
LAISPKGKRKVTVKGRHFLWTVEDDKSNNVPEEGFIRHASGMRCLHIISTDKQFIVHYQIPEPGDASATLTVEGPEFPRLPGARQVAVPRWRHDSKRYPTADFVRRLIGWCLGLE